jgi:integrase
MPAKIALRVPSYRRHKPTGQAVVTLSGKDHYLGKWNTAASRAEYGRLTGQWLAAGRCLPSEAHDQTVAEVALLFWRFAEGYYRKDGRPTSELDEYKQSLRPLRQLYGSTSACDFGPLALKTVRQTMIDAGLCRGTINRRVNRIKRLFKWAVAEELIPPSVAHGLAALAGLRKGRSEARESKPVRPVADSVVDATLPYLPTVIAEMVRLQRLTGTRPAEVCAIRPCDVDTTGDVWTYRPQSHKTEHHGCDRIIFIGPKAQEILRPYLLRDKTAYCFVPAESERKRNTLRRENRRSPMTPSQARRRPKRHPRRAAGDWYRSGAYLRAVHRAVKLANRERAEDDQLPQWSPNKLRHSAATEIRKRFGLEAAQVTLGHTTANVTQVYAERDMSLAAEVMRKIG